MMVLDLEPRLSHRGHFDRWPYQARPQADPHHLSQIIVGDHTLQATWTSSNPTIDRIVHHTATLAKGTCDTNVSMSHGSVPSLSGRSIGQLESSPRRHETCQDVFHPIETLSKTEARQQLNRRTESRCPFPKAQNMTGFETIRQELTTTRRYQVSANPKTAKRMRTIDDVDGPGTGHLSCKKRRLRLQLITSRLSQPFSLPATHILNRESDEDTPVISQFVKLAALRAKKAGHQTAMVRKAAILNRVRLNVRHTAVARGHERMYRMTRMGAMSHGLQLVTDSTGAMFPGRSGEQVPGPIVPRAWRPHTTAITTGTSAGMSLLHSYSEPLQHESHKPSSEMHSSPTRPLATPQQTPLPTSIMTPLAGADEDEASFPDSELDSMYSDGHDDDMDVYADFGVLFGGAADSEDDLEGQDDHFYEEYLDEVDGIIWAS